MQRLALFEVQARETPDLRIILTIRVWVLLRPLLANHVTMKMQEAESTVYRPSEQT